MPSEVTHISPIVYQLDSCVLKRQDKVKDFRNKSQETGISTLLYRVQNDVHQTLLYAIRDVFC